MSRIHSRAVARLCMVMAMMLLATACDLPLPPGGSNPPPVDRPTTEASAEPEDPPSDHGGHDHGGASEDPDVGASEDPDGSSEEPGAPDDEDFGNDVDPDMVEVTEDMLLDGVNGSGELQITDSDEPIPSDQGPFPGRGTFRIFCQLSHMNFDDPIVFPGERGASHAHQFIGNTGTDADSTAQSIASSGNSTCTGGIADRSAYWAPVVVDTATNEVVRPSFNAIYYQSPFGDVDAEQIEPIPEGLMMIAGDPARAPGDTESSQFGFSNARWACFNGGAPQQQGDGTTIPGCGSGQSVEAIIVFPNCWDGENLDSADHQSHMAYSSGRSGCPESHPVMIPQIMQVWLFPVEDADPSKWRLASDMYPADQPGGASIHADFVNGWDPQIMERWLNACIRPELDCERSELGNGERLGSGRGPL